MGGTEKEGTIWVDDSHVSICQNEACSKEFNIKRRKVINLELQVIMIKLILWLYDTFHFISTTAGNVAEYFVTSAVVKSCLSRQHLSQSEFAITAESFCSMVRMVDRWRLRNPFDLPSTHLNTFGM